MKDHSPEHNNLSSPHTPSFGKSDKPQKKVYSVMGEMGTLLLFDMLIPIASFYGLRAMGVHAFVALMLGSLPTIGFVLYQIIRHQKVDMLALLVLAVMAFSVAMSFATGSARFMLARGGGVVGLVGSGFLVSLFLKKPLAFTITRSLLQRAKITGQHLDKLWNSLPHFRHVWRISTIIWGVGFLGKAVVLVVMAYSLPVDVVPVLDTVLHIVTFVALQIITHIYYQQQGIWKLIFNHDLNRVKK
ncbi:VC0807 family protein [Catalinimonas niigatensis]|uniref:VC0807 family protein n=1 Tax=Catalinimonas niigatensis TaxID=1397264 RepID=UPI002666D555|nr:VC0807 family protein [Catalinimonas niigatensis]WPP51941.1 VC0807 family protein [Catalinimonas niigatensis]